MSELKNQISQFIDTNAKIYQDISLAIHAKPEVSDFEYFASQTLSEQLKKEGFEIELPAAGHRTGFAATYKSNKPGPTVVFLAEYDALAGLGHGCGHNVFGATSSLAGAALKSIVDQIGGEVRVYGTPGEEGGQNGSAKGSFVKKGYLNDVDFALCTHPGSSPEDGLSTRNYACAPVDIEFWGKPAHAAGCPQDGINALDAQILTYAAIGVLRQQLTDRIRIHGVIVEGGTAPNVIPEYTKAKYYIRAADIDTLHEVYEKVENIVKGSALQTGCTSSMKLYQNLVENMVLTPSLDAIYEKYITELGNTVKHVEDVVMPGSSDVGNISQVVPTIQPHISITDVQIAGHSQDMVNASCSQKAMDAIVKGAKALAFTALELFENPEELVKVKEDHAWHVEHQKEN
ncbi:M20 family metallopeptidase [Holdemanella biformis]|uniref:M20 family metallopeptidase n=1 Tax=Holdemanella biformis TaxID=1735 RepID=UPI001C382CB7|nr:M20 family metallopeptidase [Holdemanella biformis]MBV4131156.1 M20 family metallopeptidase [Holdemanella biformis]MBV4150938.1 M20 family metallopeptidase [Holdemanella biformis]